MFAPDAKQAFPGTGLGEINGFAGALHQAQSGVVTHAENLSHFTGAIELVSNEALEYFTLALGGTQGRVNVLPRLTEIGLAPWVSSDGEKIVHLVLSL